MPVIHMIVPESRVSTSSTGSSVQQPQTQLHQNPTASSSSSSLTSTRRKSVFSALFGSRQQANPEDSQHISGSSTLEPVTGAVTGATMADGEDANTALASEPNQSDFSARYISTSQTMANLNGELDEMIEPDTTSVMEVDEDHTIRLTPFIDHSSSAPFLYFGPIIRKVIPGMNIPIGRYTDKLKNNAAPDRTESIVFKSKVVSRSHAELCVNAKGEWFIKDIKSSSGTFLNRLRLSPAGVESTNHMLRDGDILQLGMDFRGGTEEIFRCVKMKIELNNSWLRRTQKFNKEAHEKLKLLTLSLDKEKLDSCAICLNDIKPCQAVFVSSCSHSWHYKCIRPIVVKSYPQFLCPNCKAVCDLESDLDEDEED
ncbi:unnamed protein product [Kuraishia capsulata CBS 1993]|uniref:RING-type E3 ubiquitin transferase n=1 Tax=Kuraishia capsulata CBS 1993 TaxID=1382522 RepID=W6MIS9_9ASCO|nr:uncharacterized protein KUCA_T00002032001 [Kuraishia capsulata CBS 1993]CDK26061.1 unnamed protein product [Kuraishia capsulata CBS 1993]